MLNPTVDLPAHPAPHAPSTFLTVSEQCVGRLMSGKPRWHTSCGSTDSSHPFGTHDWRVGCYDFIG